MLPDSIEKLAAQVDRAALAEGVVVGLHYRGVEFVENDAVPAATLRRCLNRARGLLEGSGGFDMGSDTKGEVRAGAALTFTVPIKITVEIDGAGAQAAIAVPIAAPAAAAAASPAAAKPGTVDRQRVLDAVRKARALLANREDVVAIKPGYRFENGQITDERAVVISVRKKVEKGALESRGVIALPDYIDGVRTDVTVASVADLLGADGALERGLEGSEQVAVAPAHHEVGREDAAGEVDAGGADDFADADVRRRGG